MSETRPNHIPGPNGLPPQELRELQGWLVWRFEQSPGEPKPRKIPYWAGGGKRYGTQGAPKDRSKLVTFDVAVAAAMRNGFDGVGLAMLPDWGITALDFDHCLLPDGRFPPEVEGIVSKTYAEYSPSGMGVRAFVRGNLGDHKSRVGAAKTWGFEVFSTRGFVTVTGGLTPLK
jgi:putative DNA primase/helicase